MADTTHVFVVNPKTGRPIQTSSRLYKRLVKQGVIKPVEVKEAEEPEQREERNEVQSPVKKPQRLKSKLAGTLTDVIADNSDQFSQDLTQDETDALLKRMLYQKLCLDERSAIAAAASRPTTPQHRKKIPTSSQPRSQKKDRRIKWKVKPQTPPSSESESSSDSSDSE